MEEMQERKGLQENTGGLLLRSESAHDRTAKTSRCSDPGAVFKLVHGYVQGKCTSGKLVLLLVALSAYSFIGVTGNLWVLLHVNLELRHVGSHVILVKFIPALAYLLSVPAGLLADRWLGSLLLVKFSYVCRLATSLLLWFCVAVMPDSGQGEWGAHLWLELLASIALILYFFALVAFTGPLVALALDQYRRHSFAIESASQFFPLYVWWSYFSQLIGTLTVLIVEDVEVEGRYYGLLMCVAVDFLSMMLIFLLGDCLKGEKAHPLHLSCLARALWTLLCSKLMCQSERADCLQEETVPIAVNTGSRPAPDHRLDCLHAPLINIQQRAEALEELQRLLHILPLAVISGFVQGFTSLLHFSFLQQGRHMDQPHSLSPCNGTESVYASLDVLEPAFIVLAVPILYKGIYPLWNTSWICCHWTLLRRLGLGIILAVVASACAAIVEVARRASSEHPEMCLSPGGHSIFKRAHMSLLWQIPQYCMYSLSKGLLIMSGYEFVFTHSTNRLRNTYICSVVMSHGLGKVVALACESLVPLKWGPPVHSIEGVQTHFTVFCCIGAAALLLFVVLSGRFQPLERFARG